MRGHRDGRAEKTREPGEQHALDKQQSHKSRPFDHRKRDASSSTSAVRWLTATAVEPLAGGEVSGEVQYVRPGYLAFHRDDLVMVQPFDLRTRALRGTAQRSLMIDLRNGIRSPFARMRRAVWSPDGRRIAFQDRASDLVVAEADGASPSVISPQRSSEVWSPSAWSLDGSAVIAGWYRGVKGYDVAILPADGAGEPEVILDTPAQETEAALSPDGNFEAGRWTDLHVSPASSGRVLCLGGIATDRQRLSCSRFLPNRTRTKGSTTENGRL